MLWLSLLELNLFEDDEESGFDDVVGLLILQSMSLIS